VTLIHYIPNGASSWLVTDGQFVQEDPVRPHINRRSDDGAVRSFRRLIARSANFALHQCATTLDCVAQSEVAELYLHLVADQNVFELQVLMDNIALIV